MMFTLRQVPPRHVLLSWLAMIFKYFLYRLAGTLPMDEITGRQKGDA